MELQTLSPTLPLNRRRIERFLSASGLRYDDVDYYAAIVDEATGEIVAGGGLKSGVIKCVAVAEAHKGEAMANTIVSHLIARANADGYHCVRLFTKPQNRRLFENLSFRLLAEAPEAVLMETGIGGIGKYCGYLKGMRKLCECRGGGESTESCHCAGGEGAPAPSHARHGLPDGVIVMNANPFTLGHRRLVEQSSELVERLYVVVVREDSSMFSYSERKAMVCQGVKDIGNVAVVDGSDYAVSRVTFPTYFLKRLDDASDTQMRLDIDLFRRHIAPSLGAAVRFVGSEPADPLTARYNQLMKEMLPDVRELPRFEVGGQPVSASRVRRAIAGNNLWDAARLVPPTTLPYIIGHLAAHALQVELDTTPKPGLVDLNDNGAHRDMDHALMQRSIRTLQPFFTRLAQLGMEKAQPEHADIVNIGIEAEHAMLEATGGVNTHKGALFALGLAAVAVASLTGRVGASPTTEFVVAPHQSPLDLLPYILSSLALQFPDTHGTHGSKAKAKAEDVAMSRDKPMAMSGARRPLSQLNGALDNAREGYRLLFDEWLPFYDDRVARGDPCTLHKTLLRIMCDLDDTNIVYRTSLDTMLGVKAAARCLLDRHGGVDDEAALKDDLEAMNRDFKARNISPGGSADMLSLVVFLHAIAQEKQTFCRKYSIEINK